jgi:hypothetical protein
VIALALAACATIWRLGRRAEARFARAIAPESVRVGSA